LAVRRGGRQHEPVDNLWMTCRVTCAKPGEFTVDCHRFFAGIPSPTWENSFHRVCKEKTLASFRAELSTGFAHSSWWHSCGERCAAPHLAVPSPHTERTRADSQTTPISRHARSLSDLLRRTGPAGYPSRVCSIRGEAIDRIADAIDQLASDAQREGPGTDLAARVADIWLMVTALDPELARRQRRYTASTTPADGAPSP
jgi:hypothetical protein